MIKGPEVTEPVHRGKARLGEGRRGGRVEQGQLWRLQGSSRDIATQCGAGKREALWPLKPQNGLVDRWSDVKDERLVSRRGGCEGKGSG